MTEENIQLPDYLCFKPSKTKIGQNGICQRYSFHFLTSCFMCSGLFTTRALKPNEPLGVYRGKVRRTLPHTADEEYVWAVSYFSFSTCHQQYFSSKSSRF